MKRWLSLVLGVLIGQWLAFGGLPSPADLEATGLAAWNRHDYTEALRTWSRGASLHPDDPVLHYRRGMALERVGQVTSAADAYRLALLLEPPTTIADLARKSLSRLDVSAARSTPHETTVALEASRGVWVVPVLLNGVREARFLFDTGSSVTLVSPALARTLALPPIVGQPPVELETPAGPTAGPSATLASLRVGAAEMQGVPVVVHDPGTGIDGILGASFLAHYRVTLDADRRLLHLHHARPD